MYQWNKHQVLVYDVLFNEVLGFLPNYSIGQFICVLKKNLRFYVVDSYTMHLYLSGSLHDNLIYGNERLLLNLSFFQGFQYFDLMLFQSSFGRYQFYYCDSQSVHSPMFSLFSQFTQMITKPFFDNAQYIKILSEVFRHRKYFELN